jgi:hypothetical protein
MRKLDSVMPVDRGFSLRLIQRVSVLVLAVQRFVSTHSSNIYCRNYMSGSLPGGGGIIYADVTLQETW